MSSTGLSNRRIIDERLEAATAHAAATGTLLSVLVLDLDEFKQINDQHGHPVGDDCLRLVSRTIEASLRPGDYAGRVGGEEFLIILPDTGVKGAWLVAERLRAAIGALPAPASLELSASFGVASFPTQANTGARWCARRERDVLGQGHRPQPQRRVQPRAGSVAHREHPRAQASHEGYLGSVLALASAVDVRYPSTTRTRRRSRGTRPRSPPASAWTATPWRRCASPGCCTTSARSACPTRAR